MGLRCESTVAVARAPADVFGWLIDADKVPRWTSGLERYEPLAPGPLRVGSRIAQELLVSGRSLRLELDIVALDVPERAELRFEGSGFRALSRYTLVPAGELTRVTHLIDGDSTSFSTRLLIPMVQGKLQDKLDADLARLAELLGGATAAA